MIWAAWRQQRLMIALWVAALAALVGYMLVVGDAYRADAHTLAANLCQGQAGVYRSHACLVLNQALGRDRLQTRIIEVLLYVLPCLGGVVLGAPLLAGELERKTNRLAWTQGVSRTRWLTAEWGVAAAAAVLPVAAVAAVVPWWRNAVEFTNVIDPVHFDFTGIVIVAYVLFAVALGAALGMLLRRTLVAALGTVVGFGLFRWWIQDGFRPHYLAPRTMSWTSPFAASPFLARHLPASAWWISEGWVSTPSVTLSTGERIIRSCANRTLRATTPAHLHAYGKCLSAHHVRYVLRYQPGSRYWPFQGIETAIFVGAALVLLGATVWLVRRWRA